MLGSLMLGLGAMTLVIAITGLAICFQLYTVNVTLAEIRNELRRQCEG